MPSISKILYLFLGTHSLLIGMFIFFLPTLLWEQYNSISHISLFIATTGCSFLGALFIWDRLRYNKKLSYIISISFVFEIILISAGLFQHSSLYLFLSAIAYGVYNCFFWVTQRLMFLENTPPKVVGKQYGTIQIVGFILVKIGIIVGAYFLEIFSFQILWILVNFISLICILYFLIFHKNIESHFSLPLKKPITTLSELIHFKDKYRSGFIFLLDGPFLFFESFFWIISLFLLSNQSYGSLGMITVFLALSFAVSFAVIRQYIDKISVKYVYYTSTILYAFSWILRALVPEISNIILLGVIVFIIAFFTSFFRLSFNKQFFDLAKHIPNSRYIVIKSYYSQASIVVSFLLISIIFSGLQDQVHGLSLLYFSLAGVSLLYLIYKPHQPRS